jgi:hypothetical protein
MIPKVGQLVNIVLDDGLLKRGQNLIIRVEAIFINDGLVTVIFPPISVYLEYDNGDFISGEHLRFSVATNMLMTYDGHDFAARMFSVPG